MAKLFQCDKCGKQTIEVFIIYLAYERTPEEIQQLVAVSQRPIEYEDMRIRSIVQKSLEVCKECYQEFKDWYFSFLAKKKGKVCKIK